jgi:hypothetical protein
MRLGSIIFVSFPGIPSEHQTSDPTVGAVRSLVWPHPSARGCQIVAVEPGGIGAHDVFACANIEESLSESAAIITPFAHADRLAVLPFGQSNSLCRDGPLTT